MGSWTVASSAAMAIEVLTLGEAMVGLVATDHGPLAGATSFAPHIAGAEANVAVGLARLGHTAAFVGRVGADGFGRAIERRLRGEGVDVAGLRVDPEARTAVFVRERRLVGPAELVYHRIASAGSRLSPDDVAVVSEHAQDARWLHISGITPALSPSCAAAVDAALDLATGHGMTVSLDVNMRRKLWSEAEARPVLRRLAGRTHVLFAGLDEAALLLDSEVASPSEAVVGLLSLGPQIAVAKLGPAGATAARSDGSRAHHEGFGVPLVVDPVGAGDAFVAGFVAAILEGLDLEKALAWGNAAGASVTATVGDMTGLPTRSELDAILAAGPDTMR